MEDITSKGNPEHAFQESVYDPTTVENVRLVYIGALVVWILIVAVLSLYRTDTIGWIILLIPPVIFLTGFINSTELSVSVEKENFQCNYFAIGLIAILPLLTCVCKEYSGDRKRFTRILVLAVIVILLSILDVWVRKDFLSVNKHIKSALQTIAITLLIYAFYIYYIDHSDKIFM